MFNYSMFRKSLILSSELMRFITILSDFVDPTFRLMRFPLDGELDFI